MVPLRERVYAIGGAVYVFNWPSAEAVCELCKDQFGFTAITITFWLAERRFGPIHNVSLGEAAGS
jgi:hypothetical protein